MKTSGSLRQALSSVADSPPMAVELTTTQARAIAHLRWRHPGAEVQTHEVVWGLIVEARHEGHVTEVIAFDAAGQIVPERRLGAAA